MAKSSILLAVGAVLAGSASAFAPASSVKSSTCLNAEEAFCRGYVGGEGPEPIPFAGIQQNSKNWDPLGFSEVSNNTILLCRLNMNGENKVQKNSLKKNVVGVIYGKKMERTMCMRLNIINKPITKHTKSPFRYSRFIYLHKC
jgi:hypothetical protein